MKSTQTAAGKFHGLGNGGCATREQMTHPTDALLQLERRLGPLLKLAELSLNEGKGIGALTELMDPVVAGALIELEFDMYTLRQEVAAWVECVRPTAQGSVARGGAR